MRSVLTAALRHLQRRSEALRARQLPGIPFTYLKPADPAYYRPFGFAYVSRRTRRALRQDVPFTRRVLTRQDLTLPREAQTEQTAQAAEETAAFMNAFLAERFEVYCLRDEHYLQDLLAELEAGGGHLELLLENEEADGNGAGRIAGTAAFDYPEVPGDMVRLLTKEVCLAPAEKPAAPFIMARIVDLAAFLEIFTGLKSHPAVPGPSSVFRFYYEDPLIPENRGTWEIRGGSAVRCPDKAAPGRMPGNGPAPERKEVPVFTPSSWCPFFLDTGAPGRTWQERSGKNRGPRSRSS